MIDERRQAREQEIRYAMGEVPELVLEHVEDLSFVHRPTMTTSGATGQADPWLTVYNEGRRSLALDLRRWVEDARRQRTVPDAQQATPSVPHE